MFELKQDHKKTIQKLESQLDHITSSFTESQEKLDKIVDEHEEELSQFRKEINEKIEYAETLQSSLDKFVFFILKLIDSFILLIHAL